MPKVLPRGIRNNNPGNIDYVGQKGAVLEDSVPAKQRRFAKFATMEEGVEALYHQLRLYFKRGTNTVAAIIGKWAPPTENNTRAYITYVAKSLRTAPSEPLSPTPEILAGLANAIIHLENGQQPVSEVTLLALASANNNEGMA